MKVSSIDSNAGILAYLHNIQTQQNRVAAGEGRADALQNGMSRKNPDGRDQVHISSQGREIHRTAALAKSLPDVREEKVAAIQTRLQNGTYEMNTEKIAMNMILESLFDEMIDDGYGQ